MKAPFSPAARELIKYADPKDLERMMRRVTEGHKDIGSITYTDGYGDEVTVNITAEHVATVLGK